MRNWGRAGVLLILLGLVAGCGGAGTSLTGGGIPAGRAVVEGTVVDSLDADAPVADADVVLTVETDATRSPAFTAQTRTGADGSFRFTEVPEGDASVEVTPPSHLRRRRASARLAIRGEETASIVICVEPDAPEYTVTSLTVSPESIETRVGQPVELTATATLADGSTVRPSWTVEGGIGRISPRGRFLPTRVGTGRILVRAGSLECVIPVTVTAGP